MTSYTRKSFSVGAPASDDYRGNWERTFRKSEGAEVPGLLYSAPATPKAPIKNVLESVDLNSLPRDVTRDVQALFEAAELVLSVEHPHGRVLADEVRALAFRIASEAKMGSVAP